MSGFKNLTTAIRAPFMVRHGLASATFRDGLDYAYDNNFTLKWRNAADTADVSVLKLDASNNIRVVPGSGQNFRVDGITKLFNRPTTDAYALECKSEPTIVTGVHGAIQCTCDAKPSTATSAAGINAVMGVGRLAATYTMTGGSLIGTYGQACNLGTLNGPGVMVAAMYGLIADGGTYTAVSHVTSGWFDSHLTKTVTAGESELLYLTNNGSTTLNSAIFLYPGNKITNLFTIDPTATGMVSDNTAGGSTLNFTNWRTIKVKIAGETHYLVAAKTIA